MLKLFNFRFDNGEWFYKATSLLNKPKKTFSEKPQLGAVDRIEKENKKVFDKSLADAAKDIVRYLV